MPLDSTLADTREEIDGRFVLRIERRFGHPVERVWDAITRPDRIVEWFAGKSEVLELELVDGGSYVTRWVPELADEIVARSAEEPLVTDDVVLHVDPPHALEHTLDGMHDSVVRWELQREGDGCRLFLTHTLPRAQSSSSGDYLAGWGMCLEFMREGLEGRPVNLAESTWEDLGERYAAYRRESQE